MEYIKGTFCFLALVSWGYTAIGYVGCKDAGIPYPEWFYPAAAAAVVTLIILIVCLIYEILTAATKPRRTKRDRRRRNRCLGVVRYEDGSWVCVRDDVEEEEY